MSLVLAVGGGAAMAAKSGSTTTLTQGSSGSSVSALQAAVGVAADGEYGPVTARAVKRAQRRLGLKATGVADAATLRALGVSSSGSASRESTEGASGSSGASTSQLEAIAQCESGGDPTAVSSSGTYRGKYQFSRDTWRAMGGSGDPAAASEAEQDRLAAKLMATQGPSAWPNCA